MTSHRLRVAAGVATLLVTAGPAFAANPRLERVLLLPVADRSSVVFELTAEPRRISTRRISDSVFEVEAGPGIDGAVAQTLKAPANVRFIDSVTVRVMPTDAGPVVRARILMTAAAQAVVRSAGRRVYVDVSPVPATPAAAPVQSARGAMAADKPVAVAGKPAPADVYRSGVRPVIGKLKELGPFLVSAAGGDPAVTTAMLPALVSVRGSLAALEPPELSRGSHTMVLAAVDRIIRTLSSDASGDRTAVVRQSLTTIDVVGEVLGE